jgi:hypothetical protein
VFGEGIGGGELGEPFGTVADSPVDGSAGNGCAKIQLLAAMTTGEAN